jgi:heme-degrading monooxygenase HmoA
MTLCQSGGNVISRPFRALAHPNRAHDYVVHLRTETFPALREIPGFVDASILARPFGRGVEFLVVTRWESRDAITAFAGADLEAAVLPEKAAEMMLEYDRRVRHFEVVD